MVVIPQRLSSRAIVASIVAVAAMAGVGATAVSRTSSVESRILHFTDVDFPATVFLSRIAEARLDLERTAAAALAAGRVDQLRADLYEDVDVATIALAEGIESYSANARWADADAGVRWQVSASSLQAFRSSVDRLMAEVKARDRIPSGATDLEAASAAALEAWRTARTAGAAAEKDLLAYQTRFAAEVQAARAESASSSRRAIWGIVVALLVGALAVAVNGVALTVSLRRTVAALLSETDALVQALGEGNLERRGRTDLVSSEFRSVVEGMNAALDANSRLYEQVQSARRDLEERVRSRTLELTQRNDDMRGVLDAVGQGLLTLDPSGRIVGEVSAAAVSWFGPLPEGSAFADALALVDRDYALAFAAGYAEYAARANPVRNARARPFHRLVLGGHTLELDLRLFSGWTSCSRVLVMITDVTDEEHRERLELELRHAQKLEAVGQIAAGIAHEVNTPIQYIGDGTRFVKDTFTSVVELLRLYQEVLGSAVIDGGERDRLRSAEEAADLGYVLEEVPKALVQVLEGVQRVSLIVRAMKEFAHPDQKEMIATDLNRALAATLEISRNEYKYVADVETDFGEIPLVSCHAGDLNQVFLNIIVNAAHAIGDVVRGTRGKGRIRVRTLAEGGEVVVSIADTGAGIPREIREKVFEPFFTTKPVGQGTGQGLAIAHSVVKNHGGQLTFESEVGRGTVFFVRLPLQPRAVPAS